MILGTLVIVHDGSYKVKVANDVCTGAVAIRCVWTQRRARCAWTERTDRWNATNYRGEILGGILALLILRAATEGHSMPSFSKAICGCNNMGVMGHGNEFWAPLQEKQCQGDLLRVLKRLVATATAPVCPKLCHIYGHQDDEIDYDDLDDYAQTNVDADTYLRLRGPRRIGSTGVVYYGPLCPSMTLGYPLAPTKCRGLQHKQSGPTGDIGRHAASFMIEESLTNDILILSIGTG